MGVAMKRSALLVVITGALMFISFFVMSIQSGGSKKPVAHPNARGFHSAIIWFELIDTPQELFLALGDPGSEQGKELRTSVDAANHYDYFFMVSYSCFYAAMFFFIYALLADKRLPMDRIILYAGIGLSVFMLIGDALENQRLLELSACQTLEEVSIYSITMLKIWTRVKWFSIFIAGILLSIQYLRYFAARLSGVIVVLLWGVPSVAGFAAFFIPGIGFLLEGSANLLAIAWITSLGHGVKRLIKKSEAT